VECTFERYSGPFRRHPTAQARWGPRGNGPEIAVDGLM